MKPLNFRTASDLRGWLQANHSSKDEIWLRLRKTSLPGPGVTYSEALDQALCFGWIDGVRQTIDGKSFAVRFTPRRAKSIWSRVNLRHYERLEKTGSMTPTGRKVFQQRDLERTGLYSFESRPKELPLAYQRTFQSNSTAWTFFNAQPPSYRRTSIFWVVSAKQEATRERRLAQLIADSAQGRRLGMLTRPADRKPAN